MASHRPKKRLLDRLGSWTRRFQTPERISGQKEAQEATLASQPKPGSAPRRMPEAGGQSEKRDPLTPSPFIVGVGRSGTTLLRLMLDAHPDLAIPSETHFLRKAVRACERDPDPRRAFLETVTSHHRWENHDIERDLLAQRIAAIEPFDLSEAVRAFYNLYAERFGKPRWGDKTPRYVGQMKIIQGLLPEAHFIHLIRDGRDVALSTKDVWFGPGSVEEAAQRWRSTIEKARRRSRKLSHYLEIRYEDLVSDTEPTLRKIGDFISLPWDPIMLDYHKTADKRMSEMYRDVTTPDGRTKVRGEDRKAIHSLTNKPPQHDRVGRWRSEMSHSDRKRFEEIAGEMLRELGYEVD